MGFYYVQPKSGEDLFFNNFWDGRPLTIKGDGSTLLEEAMAHHAAAKCTPWTEMGMQECKVELIPCEGPVEVVPRAVLPSTPVFVDPATGKAYANSELLAAAIQERVMQAAAAGASPRGRA